MLKSILRRILPVTAVLLTFSACASQHAKLDANPAFSSHQYSSHDLDISWKSEKTDTGIRIAGIVTNVRNDMPYNALELTAKLLDEQGNLLAQKTHAFPSRFAGSEPFVMDIPVQNKEMAKQVSFSYSYGTEDVHFLRDFKSEL